MKPDRQEALLRLEAALAPFTAEAEERGRHKGFEQGVLAAHAVLLHWSVSEVKHDQAEMTRRIQATTEAMKVLEDRFEIIRETYPPLRSE